MHSEIVAAADGSSLSNPGPAGWAWYIDDSRWAAGGWERGTNNMGELMAVLNLLESTASDPRPLRILCDSQYVINSLTKWMPGWKRKGWKKGDGKPVLNVELMKALDAAMQGRELRFEWVKGHAGHALNEAADSRARAAAEAYQSGRRPNTGPGYSQESQPAQPAGEERFAIGQTDEEPSLFEFEPAPATPGTASLRVKAAVQQAAKPLFGGEPVAALLHPDFAVHGAWPPSGAGTHEVLGIDQYADGVVGMRWQQEGAIWFHLWQKAPSGWRLRFSQSTPRLRDAGERPLHEKPEGVRKQFPEEARSAVSKGTRN